MKTVNASELHPLDFTPSLGTTKKHYHAPSNKIGWLHSISDVPGATFDLTIRDGLGRIKLEKKNCYSETEKYGELLNLDTKMGEDLEIEISSLQGAKAIHLFLN